jgi:hypothetical protein
MAKAFDPFHNVRLGDLTRLAPASGDWESIYRALDFDSATSAALLGIFQLDLVLEDAIKGNFVPVVRDKDELIFGATAPLGNTNAKIHLCYSLGIVGHITKSDCLDLCKIRNIFAHSKVVLDFETQAIKNICLSPLPSPHFR